MTPRMGTLFFTSPMWEIDRTERTRMEEEREEKVNVKEERQVSNKGKRGGKRKV